MPGITSRGIKGDFNFTDNAFISHFGYDSGFVYDRFDEEEIDSGDATESGIDNEIQAGNFNIFIGQFAPVSGVPIYNNTTQQRLTSRTAFRSALPPTTTRLLRHGLPLSLTRGSSIAPIWWMRNSMLISSRTFITAASILPVAMNIGSCGRRLSLIPLRLQNDQLGFNGAASFENHPGSRFGLW